MLRPSSVKGVILTTKQDDALRSPEHVERVWDDAVDGAWAPGKAPVTLLSALLQHVQDGDVGQAEATATEILAVEPRNQLVQDLVVAMKQQRAIEDRLESEEDESDNTDGDDEEEGEDDDSEEEEDEDDEEEESPEEEREHK